MGKGILVLYLIKVKYRIEKYWIIFGISFDTMKYKNNLYAYTLHPSFLQKRKKKKFSPIINKWIRFDFDVSGIPMIMPGGDGSISFFFLYFFKQYICDVYTLSSCY